MYIILIWCYQSVNFWQTSCFTIDFFKILDRKHQLLNETNTFQSYKYKFITSGRFVVSHQLRKTAYSNDLNFFLHSHFLFWRDLFNGVVSILFCTLNCHSRKKNIANKHGRHLGGDRGTRPPPHVLKGGGHNIKCSPHVFWTFVCVPPKVPYPYKFRLERGLKLYIFSSPNTKFS